MSLSPPTLRDLLADRALGLRLLAPAEEGDLQERLDRRITWVHVSELPDPTPFLDGGELLLTTGLAFGVTGPDGAAGPRGVTEPAEFRAFVARLTERGVTGLGFGTGLSHRCVPPGLVRAAREAGMPLLEVPHGTPFIAISKAASAALAAAEYAEVTTTNAAQQALAKAALGPGGPAGVVRRLARQLGGRVLLLDGDGTVLHGCPADSWDGLEGLREELGRLRDRSGPASATFTLDDERFVVQTLGGRPGGYLAVGRPAGLSRGDQTVLNSAAMLLTLALARSRTQQRASRRLRTALLQLMLAGRIDLAREPAADLWGPLPAFPVRVICALGSGRARARLAERLETEPAGERGSWFFAELPDRLLVLVCAAGPAADRVSRLANPAGGTGGRMGGGTAGGPGGVLWLGVSEPVDERGGLEEGHRQASQAAGLARRSGRAVALRFADISGHGLLGLIPPGDAAAFASSLLGPLRLHDTTGRGELVRSLRAWLAEHGQWDPAAARLGVHRHTLRNRIRKVEELAGISLDSPRTRAELWLALELLPE